jgi:hypothetical protein
VIWAWAVTLTIFAVPPSLVIAVVAGGAVTASLWRDHARPRRIDQPNEPVRE